MEQGILDFNKLLSIWWSFVWRTVLASSIAGALLGFLGGMIVGFAGYPGAGGTVGALLGWLVTFPISIWALNAALRKKHKGYVIQLTMPE